MKDKHGRRIVAGSWLLCVNDMHCGEVIQVESACGCLMLPDCNSIDCGVPLSEFATEDGAIVDYIVIDNPTKSSAYTKAVQKYAGLDLTQIGGERYLRPENLSLEQIARLRSLGYDMLYPEGNDGEYVSEMDVIAAGCDDVEYEYVDVLSEEDSAEELLSIFIKDTSHYLVFASGCRWNGASGYSLCDSRHDTVYRPYDATIIPIAASPNGKTLVCRESSHDVPMGSTTVIVALTDREYEWLESADFDEVRAFAEEQEGIARKYKRK